MQVFFFHFELRPQFFENAVLSNQISTRIFKYVLTAYKKSYRTNFWQQKVFNNNLTLPFYIVKAIMQNSCFLKLESLSEL